MSREMRQFTLDIGCGLCAFAFIRFWPIITGQHQDIRPFVLTTFIAFLSAALYRFRQARTHRSWALLCVSFGGVTPGVVLRLAGMSLTANAFFVLFLTTSLFATALGGVIKLLWWRNHHGAAVIAGCLSAMAVTVIAYRTVPDWLDRRAFQAVDRALAPFSLHTLEGKALTSDGLRGHVVVLSFWATWCLPCQGELPRIAAVSKHYRSDSRVLILAVDSGTEGDTVQKVHSYLLRRPVDVPVVVDSMDGNAPGPAATNFAVPSLPALYVLDTNGRLRSIHLGYEASEDLEASLSRQIDHLL